MNDTPDSPYIKKYRSQPIHDDLRVAAERIVATKIDGLDTNYPSGSIVVRVGVKPSPANDRLIKAIIDDFDAAKAKGEK